MTIPTGKNAALMFKKETDFGVAVTPTQSIEFSDDGMTEEIDYEESDGIDASDGMSKLQVVQGLKKPAWGFTWRIIHERLANLFELGFGSLSEGNPALSYPLPSATIEVAKVTKTFTFAGCKCQQLEVSSGVDQQWVQAKLNGPAATVTPGADTTAASWSDTEKPLLHRRITLKHDSDAAVKVDQLTWRVINSLAESNFANAQTRQAIEEEDLRSVEGEMVVTFDATNYHIYEDFVSGDFVEIKATYTYGTSGTVVLTFANCGVRGELPKLPGRGRIAMTIPFVAYNSTRALQDAVACAITADA